MLMRSDVLDYDELRISIGAGPTGPPAVRMEYVSQGSPEEAISYNIDPDLGGGEEFARRTRDIILAPSTLTRGMRGDAIDRVEGMGRELFARLLGSEGKIFFMKARERAQFRQWGLRLWLDTGNPTVALVPWEFLHDGRDFINLSSSSPVVRRNFGGYQRSQDSFPALQQLRVLVATVAMPTVTKDASGQDLAEPYIDSLNRLKDSFPQLSLEIVRNATMELFSNAVYGGQFEVIMYLGWDCAMREGLQELTFMAGSQWETFSTNQVKRMLLGKPEVRMVYLCAGNSDMLARELVLCAPGVIGITGLISDPAAQAFTEGLFTGILQGQPLEAAVTQGRFRIDAAAPGGREWGLPVFYLNHTDGWLLALEPPIKQTYTGAQEADIKAPPADAVKQREWKKFQSLLAIKHKNLQVLQEQKATLGIYGSQKIEAQIEQTQLEINELKTKMEDIS